MSRKKRRNKNYDVSGTVEVYNITKGRRRFSILNFDEPVIIENIEISGSIVTKTSIYEGNVEINKQ
jgi:aldehyde:ferredoxin oxidoreductase